MAKKKKPQSEEELQEMRSNTNPFEDADEKDGVDLDDPLSERNSFLDNEENGWDEDDEEDLEDENDENDGFW